MQRDIALMRRLKIVSDSLSHSITYRNSSGSVVEMEEVPEGLLEVVVVGVEECFFNRI